MTGDAAAAILGTITLAPPSEPMPVSVAQRLLALRMGQQNIYSGPLGR